MTKIAIVAVLGVGFVQLAACSGSAGEGSLGNGQKGASGSPSASESGSGSNDKGGATNVGCTKPGLWRESFTRLEGDATICEDIRPSEFRPTGNVNADKRKCEEGCSCQNGIDAVSCNASIKETCVDEDATKALDCAISKVSDAKLSGTCTFAIEAKGSAARVTCKYAIAYDWIAP
jgi:hypothetical protein